MKLSYSPFFDTSHLGRYLQFFVLFDFPLLQYKLHSIHPLALLVSYGVQDQRNDLQLELFQPGFHSSSVFYSEQLCKEFYWYSGMRLDWLRVRSVCWEWGRIAVFPPHWYSILLMSMSTHCTRTCTRFLWSTRIRLRCLSSNTMRRKVFWRDLLVWWSRFEWGRGCCFSFPNCFWVHLRRSWPRYWSYLCSISITCSRTRSLEVCYKTLSIAYHVCSLSAALRLVSITHSSTRMLHLISIRPPIH